MTDATFSPWPAPGKWFYFTRREAVRVYARPAYAANDQTFTVADLRHFDLKQGKFWFFAWNFWGWHGYAGYRPITMADPAFYFRDLPSVQALIAQNRLFVEWVGWPRLGIGAIS